MRSSIENINYRYTPELIVERLKKDGIYNEKHNFKDSYAKSVADYIVIYDEYNVTHKKLFYDYLRKPILVSTSAVEDYYTPERIYDLYKNRTGKIPKEDLSETTAKNMKSYIIVKSEYNIRHRLVLFDYIKGTRLNIENAIDKNNLLKIQFEKKHKGKFDYSLVEYKGNHKPIQIICKKHGEFEQTPSNHKKGAGCRKCSERLIGDMNSVRYRVLPLELVKLASSMRALIRQGYKRKTIKKQTKTIAILGCSWENFKNHLEDNPYGFKINQKGLDLDHIKPISTARTEEDIITLNRYDNFQLIPSYYNRHIKKDKKWDRDDFEKWLENQNLDSNIKSQIRN